LGYENGIISLEVHCSIGTYIRTLIEDIGKKLNCGAHVITLRRTGFSHIDIQQTIKFSDLEALESEDFSQLDQQLIKSESMLPNINTVYLNPNQSIDIRFGRKIEFENTDENWVKIFDENKTFLGMGQISNNQLQPKRLFV
jgi:tRNA pseudouridine55 synthase